MFFQLCLGLEGTLRLTLIQKEGLCPLRLLSLLTEFSIYAPPGYSTREQLSRGRFFEGLQNYMQNKNEGNKRKIIPGDLNCTMNKIERDGERKDFIDVVPIMPCQNSS